MTTRVPFRRISGAALTLILALAPVYNARSFSAAEEHRVFAKFDTDQDGRISQMEYKLNKVDAMFRPQPIDEPIRVSYQDTQLSRQAFDSLNQNGDGVLIGAAEILRFDHVDKNGDGFIDRDEFATLARSISR